MSQKRQIWNDGQGLATPDLQRMCDTIGGSDDRAFEPIITPGEVQKKVMPLSEETTSINPRLICIPSTGSLTPAGANGKVRIQPAVFVAGSAGNKQVINMTASMQSPADSALIGSNSSGSIRFDLVYATIARAVTVTDSRKIKSVVDGSISPQTVNLEDAPSVSINVNPGFKTGSTPPTGSEITAALPSDNSNSYSFALCYVTVADGYSSGTVLHQNVYDGATHINQCWNGGWIQPHRVHGMRPCSFLSSSLAEKPLNSMSERWGSDVRFFGYLKVLPTTSNDYTAPILIDNTIDWRYRFFFVTWGHLSSASALPYESLTNAAQIEGGVSTGLSTNGLFSSMGRVASFSYGSSAQVDLLVGTDGTLCLARNGTLVDGTSGDVITFLITASDQFSLGV